MAEDVANRLALVRSGVEFLDLYSDEYGIARHIDSPYIVTMQTKTGLILESTGGLTSALNVLLHCVATEHKGQLKERLDAYRARVQSLKLYCSIPAWLRRRV